MKKIILIISCLLYSSIGTSQEHKEIIGFDHSFGFNVESNLYPHNYLGLGINCFIQQYSAKNFRSTPRKNFITSDLSILYLFQKKKDLIGSKLRFNYISLKKPISFGVFIENYEGWNNRYGAEIGLSYKGLFNLNYIYSQPLTWDNSIKYSNHAINFSIKINWLISYEII